MKRRFDIGTAYETYCKWWLGKYVRTPMEDETVFHKVINIDVLGPPSFVYGQATLYYEDGSEQNLPYDPKAYRPRKFDMIVIDKKD